jgi:hypothetical protein
LTVLEQVQVEHMNKLCIKSNELLIAGGLTSSTDNLGRREQRGCEEKRCDDTDKESFIHREKKEFCLCRVIIPRVAALGGGRWREMGAAKVDLHH